jgi:hypothetical protein
VERDRGRLRRDREPLRIGQTELKKDKPLRIKQLSYAIPEALTRRQGKLAVWIVPQPSKPGPAVFGAALLEQP